MTAGRNEEVRFERAARFSHGVYGKACKPVLRPGPWYEEPPSYQASRCSNKVHQFLLSEGSQRCFFTGVTLHQPEEGQKSKHPRLVPWMGTRDHLVPSRRTPCGSLVAEGREPPTVSDFRQATIWCASIVNDSLGLSPLPVRLTLRRWLACSNFDPGDHSIGAGENILWLVVSMLDHFRLDNGRYFWSRNAQGYWWNADVQEPLMRRCYQLETEFLRLDDAERNKWIKGMRWRF